jgi:hypothetical protein
MQERCSGNGRRRKKEWSGNAEMAMEGEESAVVESAKQLTQAE